MRKRLLTPDGKVFIVMIAGSMAIFLGAFVCKAAGETRLGWFVAGIAQILGSAALLYVAAVCRTRPLTTVIGRGALRCVACGYPVERDWARCPECGAALTERTTKPAELETYTTAQSLGLVAVALVMLGVSVYFFWRATF